jgi:hypothetical protein
MNIFKLLLIVFLFGVFCLNAQSEESNTFQAGEVVTYHAYYNWHFIWLNAGIVHFSVEEKQFMDEVAWFFSAIGRTYSSYDPFMKVRDTFEVYVDKDRFQPLNFKRITNEGSTKSQHKYSFDYSNQQIYTSIRKGEEGLFEDSVVVLKEGVFDVLSMIYKARGIDYEQYEVGQEIPIRMIVDGEIHDLYIRYLGKETIGNRDGRKFRCLKFSPLLVSGTIFKSGEDMTVWVTDDKCRIPIIVEAKVLIGSVKAVFVEAKGLQYPLNAEVFGN